MPKLEELNKRQRKKRDKKMAELEAKANGQTTEEQTTNGQTTEQSTEQEAVNTTATANLNNYFYNAFKSEIIQNQISTLNEPIRSIRLDGNLVLIEESSNSYNDIVTIVESLNLDIPNFIDSRLTEGQILAKAKVPDGTTSLNKYLADDIAQIFNKASINCTSVTVDPSGKGLAYYDDKGNLIDIDNAKAKAQEEDNKLSTDTKTVTKEDVSKLCNTLVSNLISNKKFINDLASKFKGTTFNLTPGKLIESNISKLQVLKLQEGFISNILGKEQEIKNTNAEQVSFSLNVNISNSVDGFDKSSFLGEIANYISNNYKKISCKVSNDKSLGVSLRATPLEDGIRIDSVIVPTTTTANTTANVNNINSNNSNANSNVNNTNNNANSNVQKDVQNASKQTTTTQNNKNNKSRKEVRQNRKQVRRVRRGNGLLARTVNKIGNSLKKTANNTVDALDKTVAPEQQGGINNSTKF